MHTIHMGCKINLALHIHDYDPDIQKSTLEGIFAHAAYGDTMHIYWSDDEVRHHFSSKITYDCTHAHPYAYSAQDQKQVSALMQGGSGLLDKILHFSDKEFAVSSLVLHKRVPIGAGLGGASSNAAALLAALFLHKHGYWSRGGDAAQNAHTITSVASQHVLWSPWILRGCRAIAPFLAPHASWHYALAVALGADIPFFFMGRMAFVEGFGEKCTPLHAHAQQGRDEYLALPAVLFKPPYAHSTKELFEALRAQRSARQLPQAAIFSQALKQELFGVCGSGNSEAFFDWLNIYTTNDFSALVGNDIAHACAICAMQDGVEFVRLTGTGSACVVVCRDEGTQAHVLDVLKKEEQYGICSWWCVGTQVYW